MFGKSAVLVMKITTSHIEILNHYVQSSQITVTIYEILNSSLYIYAIFHLGKFKEDWVRSQINTG